MVNNQDIIVITDDALSKGTFWATCERNNFCKFMIRADDLMQITERENYEHDEYLYLDR